MANKTYGEMFEDVVDQVWLTNTFTDWLTETKRIKRDINQIQKQVLSISKSYLTKAGVLISWWTVAAQNNYDVPDAIDKITSVKITSGGINYYPKEISNDEFHKYDNISTSSDTPVFWTIDKTQLFIYPTPTSNSLPIELNANEFATDLNTDPSASTDIATALEIKEWYENVIYYYTLSEAFNRLEDFASGDRYLNKFEKIEKTYKNEVRNSTNNIVVSSSTRWAVNPNLYPTIT
jgi:hypothetical protein